jgi:hypothetical protein
MAMSSNQQETLVYQTKLHQFLTSTKDCLLSTTSLLLQELDNLEEAVPVPVKISP